jgi:hypothetical protein
LRPLENKSKEKGCHPRLLLVHCGPGRLFATYSHSIRKELLAPGCFTKGGTGGTKEFCAYLASVSTIDSLNSLPENSWKTERRGS